MIINYIISMVLEVGEALTSLKNVGRFGTQIGRISVSWRFLILDKKDNKTTSGRVAILASFKPEILLCFSQLV